MSFCNTTFKKVQIKYFGHGCNLASRNAGLRNLGGRGRGAKELWERQPLWLHKFSKREEVNPTWLPANMK